jgi:hypothetical protein
MVKPMRRIARVALSVHVFVMFCFAAAPANEALGQVVPAFNQVPAAQPIYARPVVQPQQSAEAEQVRGWYRDYLGREPGPELTAWVELLRGGMSPLDVQATILGSDEFFNQKGRDPQTFVLETLQAITWQAPTNTDMRRWTDRLTQLRGDRFALVREMLMTNTVSQPNVAAGTVVDLSTRLVSAARLLGDTAAFELTGTLQGQQVALRSQALLDSSESFRRAVAQRNFRPESLEQELRDVERAFDAVQVSLSNPPGTAPSTTSLSRRVSTLLSDTRASLRLPNDPVYGDYPPSLPGNPGTGGTGAVETQRILAQIDSISRGTQSIIQLYQSRGSQDYTSASTLRDLDTFAGQLDTFRFSVQRSSSPQRLQWEFQQLQEQGARIRPQLLQGQPPVFTRLYWQSVESGLAQLGDTLARSTGNVGTVPGTGPITGPITPGPVYRPNQELLLTIDEALGQSDAFLAGLTPFVFGIPEVPRLQRDMRTLKGHLAELRQSVVQGNSQQINPTEQVRLLKLDFDTAYARWSTIVEGYKLINYTRLSPVGRSIDQIDQLLQQDRNYIDVARPVYGSRLDQLIRAIGQDTAAVQTTLQGLANYTESRTISQGLGQLDAYNATLTTLQRDRLRTYDEQRRTVALMQRVVQNVDANTARLEDRALALRDRDGQLRSADVRRYLERITGTLNDLEREVNQ